MFQRIAAKFFWDFYDYLGRLILANILMSLAIMGLATGLVILLYPVYVSLGRPPIILAIGAGLFVILALPLPAAGISSFLSRITEDKEPEVRDILQGLRLHYWPLVKLTAVFVLLFEALLVNILFYLSARRVPSSLKLVSMIISGLCVWIFLYLGAMMLYAYPLAVHQKVGMKKIIIRSFVLVLDNLGVTLLALILVLGILGLGLVTKGAAFLILNLALIGSLANSLYVNVMEKYEIRETQNEKQEASSPMPASWKEIKDQEFIEDRHQRYRRKLRDILKPWEY